MPSQEIYISEKEQEIWNRVRDLAIASGLSISALVTRTMAAYLEEHETPAIRAAQLRTKAATLRAQATVNRRYAATDTLLETGRESAGRMALCVDSAAVHEDQAAIKEQRAAELEAEADALEAEAE